MWCIQWEPGQVQDLNSVQELDAVLDKVHSECKALPMPLLVVVQSPQHTFTIGLGCGYSVLTCGSVSGDPPYYVSVGEGRSDDVIVFSLAAVKVLLQ